MLVNDDGIITGIIDWDDMDIRPPQDAAAAYLWDPLLYGWSKDSSPEDNAAYDSPAELAPYRTAHLDAITHVSNGKPTHITRNSHI